MSAPQFSAEEAIAKVSPTLAGLPDDYRQRVIDSVQRAYEGGRRVGFSGNDRAVARAERKRLQGEMDRLHADMASLGRERAALSDMIAVEEGPRLERLENTAFHKFCEAISAGTVIAPAFEKDWQPALFNETMRQAGIFVVEHDWASAFSGAEDFEAGDVRLPYERSVFELRISGFHFLAIFFGPGIDEICVAFRNKDGWAFTGEYRKVSGIWGIQVPNAEFSPRIARLPEFIWQQVRAIAIALDSEVAVSEVVRAPHKLNAAREKRGALPLRDYHVISLARRSRATPLAPGAGSEGTRKRLHFRRGHWRHYEDHKTWIRWTLVGDPDLGFIDKHYRL